MDVQNKGTSFIRGVIVTPPLDIPAIIVPTPKRMPAAFECVYQLPVHTRAKQIHFLVSPRIMEDPVQRVFKFRHP